MVFTEGGDRMGEIYTTSLVLYILYFAPPDFHPAPDSMLIEHLLSLVHRLHLNSPGCIIRNSWADCLLPGPL